MVGFSDRDAIWLATIPGASNFFFTIIGLVLVDRIGRRKLLICSMAGVIFSFALLSGTFVLMSYYSPPSHPYDSSGGSCQYRYCGSCVGNSECGFCVNIDEDNGGYFNGTCVPVSNESTQSKYRPNGEDCALFGDKISNSVDDNVAIYNLYSNNKNRSHIKRKWFFHSCPNNRFAPLAIFVLFLYLAFFAPGMGPLPWTVNSEIYPTWARSIAISIATMTNWICNLIVSMTFLTLADDLGQPLTFALYACLSVVGLIFIVLLVPETRGKNLEEVGSLFQRPYFINWFCKGK